MDHHHHHRKGVVMMLAVLLLCVVSSLSSTKADHQVPAAAAAAAAAAGSVFFIDSPIHHYFRPSPSSQTQSLSLSDVEVGAALSVLLGLAPPPMLSADSSSKLNELLMPNPFHRPRRVFMLEIGLAQDIVFSDKPVLSGAIKSEVMSNSGNIGIEITDSEEITFSSLDAPDSDLERRLTDKQLTDFASSFGGSYVADNAGQLNGELIISLPSGQKLNLHLSKKADQEFTAAMIHLIERLRKLVESEPDISGSDFNIPELVGGYFDGLKALQQEYASEDIAQQAMEILLATVSKALSSLQSTQNGEIVAVLLFSKPHSSVSQRMLDVTYALRPLPRLLEEAKISPNITAMAEVALVRITLAWITGIILLIATFIGVYLLLNMPVTRDTLLYSNVKLD